MTFQINDRVYCEKTELFSTAFYGLVTKLYEHSALIKVEPEQLIKKETDKIESFDDLVVIRQTELQLVDESGSTIDRPDIEIEAQAE
ncbi:hypothetical protein [Levilactobacillus bambusae]|uniref:DUF2187 domain-containing protein n=1 Tax=Levilactobacillus bambusae TaxID=2024736 RepID=A0A2V1MZ43_9LACO|nr:hypothetical protein [Levilactobacillus bambusae]PWF99757.1 hypothetical protein DCM90_06765 [Levilactobacillus bambusae]